MHPANPPIHSVPQWRADAPELGWLLHGFSTRHGRAVSPSEGETAAAEPANSLAESNDSISVKLTSDELNLGFTPGADPQNILENRRRFTQAVVNQTLAPGHAPSHGAGNLVTLRQMHSRTIRRVSSADIGDRASLWGDGLLTSEPGVLLGIQTADCLPILIADPKRHAVAALHAGWRGTLKAIAQEGVAAMQQEFGSLPADLTAAIGPGIGSCCFAVGPELLTLFTARFSYAEELFLKGETLRLDLVEANRRQLLMSGLNAEAIYNVSECTSCHKDRYFSYRAERGQTGRLMAVIGIAAR